MIFVFRITDISAVDPADRKYLWTGRLRKRTWEFQWANQYASRGRHGVQLLQHTISKELIPRIVFRAKLSKWRHVLLFSRDLIGFIFYDFDLIWRRLKNILWNQPLRGHKKSMIFMAAGVVKMQISMQKVRSVFKDWG